ncbi:Hypoxia induced protein, domain [Plasmopara halstedii]|uniref:Hypoxia induced protein, domain n=1 Tax=Plasmopara halstedii TaxID=4781 RepID=A0A0P1A9T4_PLAHL|nr:Hypoxia induced protein, domain [Plasmopara halstedii]CEG36967.1 Hypoxia induced protein, domain [Plasmopara halstedii]|eukprot:XP_024573336.1 Hypoxia induced protein, domain [Plasmopara halstedii]
MNGFPMESGVLAGGLASFRRAADAATQQKFMRMRVIAQGATVVAMALGGFIAIKPDKNNKEPRNY